MIIALDYDDTYTLDPNAWDAALENLIFYGHTVYVVTYRKPDHRIKLNYKLANIIAGIYYTSGIAKRNFMYSKNIKIDVWIDDTPEAILFDKEK